MRLSAAIVSLSLLLVGASARADDKSANDLFAEGQRLMKAGSFKEACPKFERSLALNPGAGTKFNLADCYEKTGQPAKALVLFRDVESLTKTAGQAERSKVAKDRADKLEPKVPTVTVRVPWLKEHPEASVTFDGRALSANDLDKPIRVDFGTHTAIARIDTSESKSEASVAGDFEAKTLTVALPEGAKVAKTSTPPVASPIARVEPPPAEESSDGKSQRLAGIVTAGVGVVAIGVGSVLALSAKSSYDDATSSCGTSCPSSNTSDANDARSRFNVASIVVGAGAAVLAGGLVLWLTAPSAKRTGTSVRLSPSASASDLGLAAAGTF